MGLVTLSFVAFQPTRPGDFEFFVTLERTPDDLSTEQRRALCLASVPTLLAATSNPRGDGVAAAASSLPYILSDREISLIEAKRKAMLRVRGARRFLRRR
jgi:hypothetical protein